MSSWDGVREQERVVTGDGFAKPLVVVTGPADNVAPPLMSDLVEGNDVGELFLSGSVEASAFLSLLCLESTVFFEEL